MNTEIIHHICEIYDIKEKKNNIIKSQKYEEAAKLRDIEKMLISKVGKLMQDINFISKDDIEMRTIDNQIVLYLEKNYNIKCNAFNSYDGISKAIKRYLKLEEILGKD